ncbi:acyl-CoA dehydrogenase family protein [Lentzea albidocapillata]|uniref:Acyl-CoA dehydrogenase n=1 Tax=Lentzea albidocapillata TaxID=40571 RepID=A0A1W2F990_9PSEU|nr:acyl-CoA dehydrogenase family protein [Lentzea albidocapillata]SMD18188.1 Acyl-CoA dehydrogenase [Lentzea albidocapillata]
MSKALATARRIADEVLFPTAAAVDVADRVPPGHLDLLAEQSFYGLASPQSTLDVPDYQTVQRIVETFAGGCLTTAFVWVQHHGAVMAVAESRNETLRTAYLADLTTGAVRAGLAAGAATRPGPPLLRATPADGGWIFDGTAPWVTGWGMVDVLHIAARDDNDLLVWALLDAAENAAITTTPVELIAVQASRTVTMKVEQLFVPNEKVTSTVSLAKHLEGDLESVRFTGSLALGVAGRAARLADIDHAELDAARDVLHHASHSEVPQARAAVAELALRTAAALVVHDGSRAMLPREHGQRLLREAGFLLVFGSRPEIKTALLDRLTS